MTLDYTKVWSALNDLESVTSRICSAREILDSAIAALENHKKDKAEALMYAVDEYLQYYLQDFDSKFKDAWNETVVKLKQEDYDAWEAVIKEREYYEPTQHKEVLQCDKDDTSSECKNAWADFYEESYYPEEYKTHTEMIESGYEMTDDGFWIPHHPQKEDKVVKWRLPVNVDGLTGDCYVNFPDDLLEAAGLEEGNEVEWVDKGDGSFLLKKIVK